MMEQEFTQRTSAYSRRLRSTTLVRIRWLAVFSQSSTIAFVALYLGQHCCILLVDYRTPSRSFSLHLR